MWVQEQHIDQPRSPTKGRNDQQKNPGHKGVPDLCLDHTVPWCLIWILLMAEPAEALKPISNTAPGLSATWMATGICFAGWVCKSFQVFGRMHSREERTKCHLRVPRLCFGIHCSGLNALWRPGSFPRRHWGAVFLWKWPTRIGMGPMQLALLT